MTILNQPPCEKVQVSVRKDLLEWIAGQVKASRFGSRSHALNYALAHLKEEVEKQQRLEAVMEPRLGP